LVSWGLGVFLFNLFWYGAFVSFPLIGEDGAANYSFLVETLRYAKAPTLTFPIKWLEGLGQPNIFVTVTFDPFSWLMRSGLPAPDAFRLSYAVRATVGWLTTCLFIAALFPGAAWLPRIGAWLNLLLCFTLSVPHGVPTQAGIPVATHAAVFPGLLWLYLRAAESPRPVGLAQGALAAGLLLFMLMFPLGSLLGLAVLFTFAASRLLTAASGDRTRAARGLATLLLSIAVILFAPGIGLYHAWSAITAGAARHVFAGELFSYGRTYTPPLFWSDVPLALRTVVLLAVAIVLLGSRWSRPLRAVALTLGGVVAGAQGLTIARMFDVGGGWLERLPRPFYLEQYLAVFYAVTAAYVLCRWRRVVSWPEGLRRWWPARIAAVAAAGWVLVGAVTVWWPSRRHRVEGPGRPRARALRAVPVLALLVLLGGTLMTWVYWPEGIHPLFAPGVRCRKLNLWCHDRPGRTMGAEANPLTDFLRARLSDESQFGGRADYVLPAAGLATEPEVGIVVQERNRNFGATGNGLLLRAFPFQWIPVASSYEQGLDYLYFLFWTRYVNQGAVVFRRSINFTSLEIVRAERLALAGVRYVVGRDEVYDFSRSLRRSFAWQGYSIYEMPDVNTAGYGVERVIAAPSLTDELGAMRGPEFDPRRVAVVSTRDAAGLVRGPLTALTSSRLRVSGQDLRFEAAAPGGPAFAVLPFRFSHCWQPKWTGPPGRIVRTNVALLGVAFDGAVRVRLTWRAGYGPLARCLRADTALVPEALAAAQALR
jgi:hypothetical protein